MGEQNPCLSVKLTERAQIVLIDLSGKADLVEYFYGLLGEM